MTTFVKFIKRNNQILSRAFIFLLGIILTVYIIPKEGKFGYEFQRGKPWMHEDLIAPFDFPIYKTQEELEREEDSILQEFKPYFQYDSAIYNKQIKQFYSSFESFNRSSNTNVSDSVLNIKLNIIKSKVTPVIQQIFQKGILETVEALEDVDKENLIIVVIRNNIAEEYDYSEFYTQKSAYKDLTGLLNEMIVKKQLGDQVVAGFIDNYNFNQIIEPNLVYDYETSTRSKQELIKTLSLTQGKIQKDVRIISKGELVTNEKYQVLSSLKYEYELKLGDSSNFIFILLGKIIFVFASFLVIFLFLYHFRIEILHDYLKTIFILFIVILFIAVSVLTLKFDVVNFYIIPFAILPITIRTFYDERTALFIHIVTMFVIGYFAPNAFDFIFLNFVVGIVAIFSLTNLYRRRRIVITSLLIILTYSFIYFGLSIVQEGEITQKNSLNYAWFTINGLLVLLAYPLLYVFEKLFGFLSDATLMELADTNQELLRKLAEEAPGTFQHSLQVANLAEEAVFQIGGNTLLVRTGALYHDIGKMENPVYFTENQKSNLNMHDHLEFEDSARIIIQHVQKGVEIAEKHKLPGPVIDFIKTHHGTTTVQYFYKSFLKKYPEKRSEIEKFKYPGPIPYSKETAVLMMADSVEAASRSLQEVNESSIDNLVEGIINYQVAEDQFVDANITFKDIQTIKDIFKKKLQNIYHVRISYPE